MAAGKREQCDRAASVLSTDSELDRLLLGQAFRLLISTSRPVAAQELADLMGQPLSDTVERISRLGSAGRIRTDESGRVVGSAGLSVVPDRHEIELGGRRFWTWCAYDILGIFGAFKANGSARSTSPADGGTLELTFTAGRPHPDDFVLFRPDPELTAVCENVYEEWCPNSNLFENEAAALRWAGDHRLEGQVLSLAEAQDQAAGEWRPLTRGLAI